MKFLGTIDEAKDVINKEFVDSLLDGYQPLITSTNKLAYSLISDAPVFSKDNIKSILGISDWALGTSKPSYTTTEVTEEGNLYFTNERAINALSDTLNAYVSLNSVQDILGEKNFVGGLKVNDSLIYYDKDKKYWKLEGDLLVTGGITMYGNDSDFVASTIMDAIAVDGTTISKEGRVLRVIGDLSGGASTLGELSNVGSWANSVASQDRIMYQAANSSMWVAKNLSDLAVGGVTGDYLPLSGGTLTGVLNVGGSDNTSWMPIQFNRGGTTGFIGSSIIALDIGFPTGYLRIGPDTLDYSHSVSKRYPLLHSGNYSSYALPLSGGTLSGAINFNINHSLINAKYDGTNYSNILYVDSPTNAVLLGSPYWSKVILETSSNQAYRLTNGNLYKIWDEGNDGSGSGLDADLLDGYDSSYLMKYGGNWTSTTDTAGIFAFGFGGSSVGLANGYGAGIQLCNVQAISSVPSANNNNANWYSQLLFGTDNRVYARFNTNGGGWSGQYKIAYTSDNVASATKLFTARTIWGQSFDGTGNVEGNISSTTESLTMYTNSKEILSFSTNIGYLSLGYGTLANGFTTYLHGYNINLRYGASGTDGLILNSSGNVGIGTTSPNSKLQVVGNTHIGYKVDSPSLGALGNAMLCVGNHYDKGTSIFSYGLAIWTEGSGNSHLQVGRGDGDTAVYNMILQPYGGNVGIGTTSPASKLDVYGNVRIDSLSSRPLRIEFASTSDGDMIYLQSKASWCGIVYHATTGHTWSTSCGSAGYFNFWNSNLNGNAAYLDVNGNFLVVGGVTMYSDIRKKTKLQDVELSLKQIANAPLIEHYYNSDDKRTTHVGSIAQYWAGLNDWFCKLDNEGYYTMEIQNAALASAISIARELDRYENKTDKKIKQLKKRISQLEDEIERLKNNIN